jgi:hypothetical protein
MPKGSVMKELTISKTATLAFLGSLLAGACSSSDGTQFSAPPGTERGECLEGGGCDPGLECRSGLCVEEETPGTGGSQSATGGSSGSGGESTGGGGASGGDSGTSSGGSGTAGDAGASGGETADAAPPGDASGPECSGAHPNVEGNRRFCDAGSCYCSDPFDTCFAADVATACCAEGPRCGDTAEDRGIVCEGTHPIVGPTRTCDPGNCLCSDGTSIDLCFPAEVARICCPPAVEIVCVEGP